MISDQATPVQSLLSEDSHQMLDALVATVGARAIDSKVTQVRYSPGKSCVVQYVATVRWGQHEESKETFVAAAGVDVPGDVARIEIDGFPVAIWRFPNDPFLPGLSAAADPKRIGKLLQGLGSPQTRTSLRRRAYRPGRRAVLEAVSPSARLFVKVVRPSKVAHIQKRHEMFAGLAPVPISHGWSEDLGLIALEARNGKPLRAALESGARTFPTPKDLVALLDRLRSGGSDWVKARSPVQSARRHAALLGTLLPHLSDTLGSVVAAVEDATNEEETWIHGDFHSSQVLVKGGVITGLVDIDGSGFGQRTDDLAGMLGQLTAVSLRSSRRRTVETYRDAMLEHFDTIADPAGLRLRTAAVLLGQATGPFRVQRRTWPSEVERRAQLAEEWVDAALRHG